MLSTILNSDKSMEVLAQAFMTARAVPLKSEVELSAERDSEVEELVVKRDAIALKIEAYIEDTELCSMLELQVIQLNTEIDNLNAIDYNEEAEEELAAAQVDWVMEIFEALMLRKPEAQAAPKPVVAARSRRWVVMNDNLLNPDGGDVLGWTGTSDEFGTKAVINGSALKGEGRKAGFWAVGHIVDSMFGIEGYIVAGKSGSSINKQAYQVWGATYPGGIERTPMQGGKSGAGQFLTAEVISELEIIV